MVYKNMVFCKLLWKSTVSYSCVTIATSFYIAKYLSTEKNMMYKKAVQRLLTYLSDKFNTSQKCV